MLTIILSAVTPPAAAIPAWAFAATALLCAVGLVALWPRKRK